MNKTLEIFALCERLAELLGDAEAIADLQRLYARHPEMFRDMREVSEVIQEVVHAPEIMTNAKREGAILVAKRLEKKHKMGEVAIENDNGTNIIFHANQKKLSELNRLEKNLLKNARLLVETPSAKAAPTRLNRCADKSNDLSKGSKAPSTADISIIPQNTDFSTTGGRVAHFLHPDLTSAWAGSKEHSPVDAIIPQNTDFSKNISTESTDDTMPKKDATCADSGYTK